MKKVAITLAGWLLWGCGGSYTADDTTSNTLGARHARVLLDLCATDDASACTPSAVRSESDVIYCANARELITHGAAVPEAGVSCQPK